MSLLERSEIERLKALGSDLGLLLLRVGSFAMVCTFHVRPKLLNWHEELATFPDPLGIGHVGSFLSALFSELACSALVALGLGTRLATLPIVFTMGMVLVVAARGFENADVQAALLYALPYTAIALLGPGRFSLDAKLADTYANLLSRLQRHA